MSKCSHCLEAIPDWCIYCGEPSQADGWQAKAEALAHRVLELADKLQRAERERDVALGDVGWQQNQISNAIARAEAAEAEASTARETCICGAYLGCCANQVAGETRRE